MTWMPIDTAPKDGTLVLLLSRHAAPSWPVTLARWQTNVLAANEGWKGPKANWAPDGAFTHWAPIPDPPSSDAV